MKTPHMLLRACAGLLIVLLTAASAPDLLAQRPQERVTPARPNEPSGSDTMTVAEEQPGLPTRAELEAFFDGAIDAQLNEHRGAGATVTIVTRDSVAFAKGYGFADVEAREPVSADTTLFRIGSVSKLFVWTAVMQLVAEGKIDLNADVNTYLTDFQVPPSFDQPITMAHLMTHTAGFEDRVIGLFADDPSRLRPLGEIVRDELPARVRPPGEVASYSNHGVGLAAHIVERVSGMSWDEYVETRILQPLGMGRTTFRQPVPEELAAGLSKGYQFENGEFTEKGFEFVPLAPAGAASATASDMGRFIRAHLNRGRLGNTAILDTATARRMQSPLFQPGPGVSAFAHGFYEMNRNGYRVIGHGGATFWFFSLAALLPENDVGLFLSFNAAGGQQALESVYQSFMDTFFPARSVPVIEPDASADERLPRFEGTYRTTRYSHTDFTKLLAAFGTLTVSATDDGRLMLTSPGGGESTYWVETGALAFREQHGLRRLAFREDDDGRITHLLLGDVPVTAFERIGWADGPSLHLTLLILTVLVLLLAVVGWPLAATVRRRHGYRLEGKANMPPVARILAWTASLLLLLFLFLVAAGTGDPIELTYGIPGIFGIAAWLPRVALVLVVAAFLFMIVLWIARVGTTGARLWYTLVVIAGAILLWQLYHWSFLTFTL